MSERNDRDYLNHIVEAGRRIDFYTAEMTWEDFLEDVKTQDAVIRNIEIVGEATKNLSNAIRGKYPEIPWKGLSGMRDRLIHHYFGVNLDIVWNVAKEELSEIVSQIQEMEEMS
jgi:uncharacterized protein with HEPN domain